ncbi:MAG: 50S ribosomal protein L21 [Thermomicrobiales bacterium]|jgi:large subunit ribosomal protein L21|nr:50S ribosomal protein L21 [Thermomicrobiales bacterium]
MSAKKQDVTADDSAGSRYAIVATGGKQYRVGVGDVITVEKLDVEAGSSVTLDNVLLIGGDGSTTVGAPLVDGASVSADVVENFRGEKIIVFKYKPKKRYRRRTGHRQEQTRLAITGINA